MELWKSPERTRHAAILPRGTPDTEDSIARITVPRDTRDALSRDLERRHVSAVYRRMAGLLRGKEHFRRWPRVEEFLRTLPAGSLVADVGCGNGKYLGANPRAFTIGSDICIELAEIASSHADVKHDVMACSRIASSARNDVMVNSYASPLACNDVMANSHASPLACNDVMANSHASPLARSDVMANSHASPLACGDVMANNHASPLARSDVMACDTLRLPYRDGVFDAVVSVGVLHHLASGRRRVLAVRELSRVLRPGGRLLVCVWALEQRHRQHKCTTGGLSARRQDMLIPWSSEKGRSPSTKSRKKSADIPRDRFPGCCHAPPPQRSQSSSASDIRLISKSTSNGLGSRKKAVKLKQSTDESEKKRPAEKRSTSVNGCDEFNSEILKNGAVLHREGDSQPGGSALVQRLCSGGAAVVQQREAGDGLRAYLHRSVHRLVGSLLEPSSIPLASEESNPLHKERCGTSSDHAGDELDGFAVREFPQSSWSQSCRMDEAEERVSRLRLYVEEPSSPAQTEVEQGHLVSGAISEQETSSSVKLEFSKNGIAISNFSNEDLGNAIAVEESKSNSFIYLKSQPENASMRDQTRDLPERSMLVKYQATSDYHSISCESEPDSSQPTLGNSIADGSSAGHLNEYDPVPTKSSIWTEIQCRLQFGSGSGCGLTRQKNVSANDNSDGGEDPGLDTLASSLEDILCTSRMSSSEALSVSVHPHETQHMPCCHTFGSAASGTDQRRSSSPGQLDCADARCSMVPVETFRRNHLKHSRTDMKRQSSQLTAANYSQCHELKQHAIALDDSSAEPTDLATHYPSDALSQNTRCERTRDTKDHWMSSDERSHLEEESHDPMKECFQADPSSAPPVESHDPIECGSQADLSIASPGDACMRYYHVFREGELVSLIRDHVPSLHVLDSYYDHANWCVVAERVDVWRI